ncbi:MAG: hypothetical protein M5R36_19885 [Deltaproteobacteria bacterium]|nr:hypothetical protein [Deltaproteobacteria bacterium]
MEASRAASNLESHLAEGKTRSLDDPHFTHLLVDGRDLYNNDGRLRFVDIAAKRLRTERDLNYLLLVDIAGVEIAVRGDRPAEARAVVYNRLLALDDGLLLFETRNEFHAEPPDSPLGPYLAGIDGPDDVRRDDFRAPREALALFGRRYGLILAWQIGYLDDAALAEARRAWAEENAALRAQLVSRAAP